MTPEVLVFSCNWNGWSSIEAATGSGLSYPPSVRVVRVSCLSRIHAGLILKAFEYGADGVMLLGCQPGECHFSADGECLEEGYEKARNILKMLGLGENRLVRVQLPAFASHQFVEQVTKMASEITRLPAFRGSVLNL